MIEGQSDITGKVVRVVKFIIPGAGEVDYHLPEGAELDTLHRMTWQITSVVTLEGNKEPVDKKGFGKKPKHPIRQFSNIKGSFRVVGFDPELKPEEPDA